MYNPTKNIVTVLVMFVSLIACTNNSNKMELKDTVYSSDSKYIYFLNTDNYQWNLDKQWGTDKYAYSTISPSGEYLAFVRFPYIALVIKNSKDKIIMDEKIQSGDSIENISWHPKETYLAFLLRRKGANAENSSDVYIMDLQTKKPICIYKDAIRMNYASPPSWSNKGDKLYFVGTEQKIIEYDMLTKTFKSVLNVKGEEVHYLSDTELVIRNERNRYYNYNLQTKELKYLFKLGWWEYPPIFLSPDKNFFFTWDTMPRRLTLEPQGYTLIREFPAGRRLKTIANKGANWFSWSQHTQTTNTKEEKRERMRDQSLTRDK
jgi:hypothetical protein